MSNDSIKKSRFSDKSITIFFPARDHRSINNILRKQLLFS